MNITHELVDNLNAKVNVVVKQEDYESKVNDILKGYRKQANMPGFRKGMVPFGMIKKMYGKSVLVEEVNKILSNDLHQYITENKLEVLGQPMPNDEDQKEIDFENDKDFEFKYKLGLAPSFDLSLSEKDKFNYYKIIVDDELIDKYIKDLGKRFGKVANVESSSEEDMLGGEFVELDKNAPKEGGIKHSSTIAIEYVEDKKTKDLLLGLKVGDTITLDPSKVSRGDGDLAQMLGISKSQAAKLKSKFSFNVTNVYQMTPHEVNQELFDKVFGPGKVNDQTEFRNKISEELNSSLGNDSDKLLKKEIAESLISKLKLQLPDAFLKDWLKTSDNDLTEEKVDEEYDDYARSLRWQLIENRIIKDNELQVKPEEAMEHTKELVRQQMAMYGYGEMPEEEVNKAASNLLTKEEEARGIYDQMYDKKMLSFYKDTLTLKKKEVSFDEFVKLATGKAPKGKLMDSINNLVNFNFGKRK